MIYGILFFVVGGAYLLMHLSQLRVQKICASILLQREDMLHHHQYAMAKLEGETDRLVAALGWISDGLDRLEKREPEKEIALLKGVSADICTIGADISSVAYFVTQIAEHSGDIATIANARFPNPDLIDLE